MNSKKVLFSFIILNVFLLEICSSAVSKEKTLDIMVENAADPWSKADGKGYANDIVIASYKEMGVRVHLDVVPYARCKASVLTAKMAACFSITYLPEFKNILVMSSNPLIVLNADVFENIAFPLPRDPSKKCKIPAGTEVGIVQAYEYPKEIMELKNVIFTKVNNDTQNIEKLYLNRIGAAIILTNNFEPKNQKVKKLKKESRVRFAFNCGMETGTIGFSLLHPKGKWAHKTFEEGYRRIKKNGKLKEIAERWFDHSRTF